MKQESHKDIIVFLLKTFIWTYMKGEKILYILPSGRNKVVHQKNNNILDEILVLLFYYF